MSERRYYYLLVNVKRMYPAQAMSLISEQKSYFVECAEGSWEKYVHLEVQGIEQERKWFKKEFPSDKI